MFPKNHLLARAYFRIPVAIPKVSGLAQRYSPTHPIRRSLHSRATIRIPAIRLPTITSSSLYSTLAKSVPAVVQKAQEVQLPSHRLLARAFHRRGLSTSSTVRSKAEDHVTREKDHHNVQHDAAREGKKERASGEGSSASSERAGRKKGEDLNRKAEKDHKEAPKPVIGMNDERGSVSAWVSPRFCKG